MLDDQEKAIASERPGEDNLTVIRGDDLGVRAVVSMVIPLAGCRTSSVWPKWSATRAAGRERHLALGLGEDGPGAAFACSWLAPRRRRGWLCRAAWASWAARPACPRPRGPRGRRPRRAFFFGGFAAATSASCGLGGALASWAWLGGGAASRLLGFVALGSAFGGLVLAAFPLFSRRPSDRADPGFAGHGCRRLSVRAGFRCCCSSLAIERRHACCCSARQWWRRSSALAVDVGDRGQVEISLRVARPTAWMRGTYRAAGWRCAPCRPGEVGWPIRASDGRKASRCRAVSTPFSCSALEIRASVLSCSTTSRSHELRPRARTARPHAPGRRARRRPCRFGSSQFLAPRLSASAALSRSAWRCLSFLELLQPRGGSRACWPAVSSRDGGAAGSRRESASAASARRIRCSCVAQADTARRRLLAGDAAANGRSFPRAAAGPAAPAGSARRRPAGRRPGRAGGRVGQHHRHRAGGVRGMRLAGDGIAHHLGIAVIGGDQHHAAGLARPPRAGAPGTRRWSPPP